MSDELGLPPPLPEALVHSAHVRERIVAEINACGGALSFQRFMELALYAPGLGYYSAGASKFGPQGDFVTAPELGDLFGACLARQAQQVMAQSAPQVLECGAGTGALAATLLDEWRRQGALPDRYTILDVSGDLRARQEQTLRDRVPDALSRVEWIDRLPESGFRGVIIGNELLDAMPVHLFVLRDGHEVLERCVIDDHGRFAFHDRPMPDDRVRQRVLALVAQLGSENFGASYVSEMNLAAEGWVASASHALERGAIMLIDYGFPQREFYHPDRSEGTLMCHYRHRAHPDPLVFPGLQDITAHVDFTAMAQAAFDAGCDVLGYANQAQFLLNCGLLEIVVARSHGDARTHLALTNEVKRLTLPSEMGELFKVLAVGRGIDEGLMGFSRGDQRHRL